MKNTRALALFLMAIISTASPTVYQLGVQPRVDGAACTISIQHLELDEENTKQHIAVFYAYLSIENPSDIDVIFTKLSLDVYHHSKLVGRPRLIGTLNITDEYNIPAQTSIFTRKGEQGLETFNPYNPKQQVVAKLAFNEDESQGSATSEAIGELIQKGFISVDLRGKAHVGPLEFDYKKSEVFKINFWDPNFVILDVFNYYSDQNPAKLPRFVTNTSSPNYNTDYATVVVRALMHNPSGVPLTLNNYTFDLYTRADESIGARRVAQGMSIDHLANYGYDPDYLNFAKRRSIKDTFLNGSLEIPLNKNPNIWSEVFFAFNFTDPDYWNAPSDPNAKTRENMQWFFTRLFNDQVIDNVYFKGEASMTIGWNQDSKTSVNTYKGIKLDIGDLSEEGEKTPFIIPNVRFHQLGYEVYDKDSKPQALKDNLNIGDIKLSKMQIDREHSEIGLEMEATLRFNNPYRLDFNITNLKTDYFRTTQEGPYQENDTSKFANGTVSPVDSLVINRTRAVNASAKAGDPDFLIFDYGLTNIPHNISLKYNTTDYMMSGIANLFMDLGLDPMKLNLTNIFWLLGPEGLGQTYNYNPTDIIEYIIKKGIDPVQILKNINTTKLYNYGDYAWYPLKASHFGTNFKQSHEDRFNVNQDIFVPPFSVENGGTIHRDVKFLDYRWDVNYNDGIAQENQYDVIRHQQTPETGWWTWEPPEYGSDYNDTTLAQNFNAIIFDNLPFEQFQDANLPVSWYPRNYVNWRIYTEQEYHVKPYWGFNYDLQGGKRGWYLVHPRTEHDILLKQNFDIDVERIKSVDDIESAWLSLSYQFPGDAVSTQDLQMIKVGMGYWNTTDQKYIYEAYTDAVLNDDNRPITAQSLINRDENTLFSDFAMYGYYVTDPQFHYENSRDWKTFRVNVTRYMKDAYRKYLNDGNPDHLRLEVAVGVRTKDTISKTINIDDIVLQVNHVQHIDGQFRFNDLMRYLEDNAGPAEGNFFHLLNELQFNASQLVGFAESTLGLRPSGSYTPTSLIRYFTTSDYSLTNMMEILNDLEKAKQTNSPQDFNFLSLLNNSRYIINNNPDKVATEYGPREVVNTDESWTVEDPYYLSREILETLKYRMFYDENGYPKTFDSRYPLQGKELWVMLENFGVTLPWVIVYLRNRGWSEDDIFDAFEAVGLFSETKQNAPAISGGSFGVLKYNSLVSFSAGLLGHDFFDVGSNNESLWILMGNGVPKRYEYLFDYLCSNGDTSPNYLEGLDGASAQGWFPLNWGQFTKPFLDYTGTIPYNVRTRFYREDNSFLSYRITIQPHAYRLAYWMYGLSGSPISYINTDEVNNPYMDGSTPGLNSQGTQALSKYLRINFQCQGSTLIRYPGDALALFQFLDDYVFGQTDQIGYSGYYHDFSSYTLMNYYNVLATDFFELAMGYNRFSDDFDANGNGLADDWVPPNDGNGTWLHTSGWYNPPNNKKPNLNGWGDDFVNNRIYWDPLNKNNPLNGKVIWSDSSELIGSVSYKIGSKNFQEGAPPIINLIDFLTWVTETLDVPSADDIFSWIEGKASEQKYLIKNPISPKSVYAASPRTTYRCGIGLQNVWEMLERGSFNMTGFVNWLQNKKKINVWGLWQEMNNYLESYSDSPNPWSFIHYLINPNMAYASDGTSRYWMYHNSIAGATSDATMTYEQQLEKAQENIWLLLNGSFWDEQEMTGNDKHYWANREVSPFSTLPGMLFLKLREREIRQIAEGKKGANLTFNLFQMLNSMGVKPEEWLQIIEQQGVLPFELLAVLEPMNYEKMFAEARENQRKTRMKVNGSFVFEVWNFRLADTGFHQNNIIPYEVDPSDFRADDNLRNFWNVKDFSVSSGTISFV